MYTEKKISNNQNIKYQTISNIKQYQYQNIKQTISLERWLWWQRVEGYLGKQTKCSIRTVQSTPCLGWGSLEAELGMLILMQWFIDWVLSGETCRKVRKQKRAGEETTNTCFWRGIASTASMGSSGVYIVPEFNLS